MYSKDADELINDEYLCVYRLDRRIKKFFNANTGTGLQFFSSPNKEGAFTVFKIEFRIDKILAYYIIFQLLLSTFCEAAFEWGTMIIKFFL